MADTPHGEMSFEEALQMATNRTLEPTNVIETPSDEELSATSENQAEVQGENQSQESAQETQTQETQTEETKGQEQSQDKFTPALERLMERERKLMEREAELEAQKKQLEQKPQDSPQQFTFEQLEAMYKADPVGFNKRFNTNTTALKQLAQDLWYEDMGEEAPDSYRATKEARTAQTKVQELKSEVEKDLARLQQQRLQMNAEMQLQQYVGELTSYAQSLDKEKFPQLAELAPKNQKKVLEGMLEAARRAARDSNGQKVLTPQEAAEAYEKEISDFMTTYGLAVAPKPEPETKQEPDGDSIPSSLRNKHTQVVPDRVEEDDLDDAVLRKRAYAALEETLGRPLKGT